MHVFLTGGTGYIGSAVLDALIKSGHRVTALVRDSEKAARLEARGAQPILGELASTARFVTRVAAADALIHTAIDGSAKAAALDQGFLDAVLPALAASKEPRTMIYTSSIWVLGPCSAAADETATVQPLPYSAWRPAHEQQVLAAATPLLRTAVVRPGVVYGGRHGLVSDMLKDALNGLVRVLGDGHNRWPCVYDRDVADLYVRILASPGASGVFHATDDEQERVADIAAAIAQHVSPTADIRFVPLAEARGKFGPYADAVALDQVARSPRARALGWTPTMHGITGNAPRLFEEYRRAASRE